MRRFLSLLLAAFGVSLVRLPASFAHPVNGANLPPTKAGAALQRARQSGAIAQQLLVQEGRFACCTRPACGMCRLNGAACPD